MKKLVAALLALAAVIGIWWYASPLIALDGLRKAAEAGDEAALEERVDFPALRDSIKGQARTLLSEAAAGKDGTLSAIAGAALGLGVADRVVDGLVTPEWVATMVAEGNAARAQTPAARDVLKARPPATRPPAPADPDVEWNIERNGFNSFRVTPTGVDARSWPVMLFERDGLGWDLVGIEVTPDQLLR